MAELASESDAEEVEDDDEEEDESDKVRHSITKSFHIVVSWSHLAVQHMRPTKKKVDLEFLMVLTPVYPSSCSKAWTAARLHGFLVNATWMLLRGSLMF